jgi:long-chain acyl-CoA synthetase
MIEHYLDRLARTINENWDQPALTDFYLTEDGTAQDTSRGNHYTYGEMYAEILHLCELFQSLGLKQGDHIAICGANSAHWAIAYLAIAAYQGIAVTILHSQSPEDIAHQIDFSDAKALFTDSDLWDELQDQSLPQVENVISLVDWQTLRGKQIFNLQSPISNREADFIHDESDTLAMICFTSGSTGVSKGVMLSYRSISNNLVHIWRGYSISTYPDIFSLLPFAHMFGLINDLLGQLTLAKHIYIGTHLRGLNDIYNSLRIVRPYAITIIPSILIELHNRYKESFYSQVCENCKLIATGGSHISKDVEQSLLEHQLPLAVGYGMTEAGPAISGDTFGRNKYYSCGTIVVGMTTRIADNGEILVKGENVMLGYYKDPEATAQKIDAEGWLHTGDKGHLDEDGYLYVEGRLEQDMIVLPNGENIHPEDIERKINALPEVKESIVLARDGKLVAIVVPQITNDQSPMTNTDLRRMVLRKVNPSLPLYSQLYDVKIIDTPLAKTEKQTIKRYLYK